MYKITKNEFDFYLNTDSDVEEFLFIHFPDTVIKVDDIEMTVEDFNIKYKNLQYQRDRAKEYPSLQEQADLAYWDRQNGTNKLDEIISAVKAKFPKPE